MKTEKFQRKPFIVDCVQVTEENMEEVARWCKGTITQTDPQIAEQLKKPVRTWIQVETQQPMSDRQKQAFVGDWLLYANHGFKIYTPKAFERTFEKVPEKLKRPEIMELGKAVRERVEATPGVVVTVPNPKSFAERAQAQKKIRSGGIPEIPATSGPDLERIQAQLAEAGLQITPIEDEA